MGEKSFQLSLVQKAMLYVAVPLLCELCLLAAVTYFLYQSEYQSERSEHAKAVIAQTEDLIHDLYDVGVAFVVFDAKTNRMFQRRLDHLKTQLPESIDSLEQLVRDEPQHVSIVRHVREETSAALGVIQAEENSILGGGHLDVMEALGLRKQLDEIVRELGTVLVDARHEQERDPQAAERLKTIVKILLLVGFVVAALALFLVARFNSKTARRLDVLMQNSILMGTGKKLAPPLSGYDEIAKIDHVFHGAVEARQEAERFKQQFTNMVSHDLRTPLTAVGSTLELVSSGAYGELNEKGQTKIKRAEGSLRQTMELINNLLDLEKMNTATINLNVKSFPLNAMLERSLSSVQPIAESRSVDIVLPKTSLTIDADEQRLSQVVINLLGNALKFSPQNSVVTIFAVAESDATRITVQDQGPGVPEAYRERIFEHYQQLEENRRKSVEVLIGARSQTTGLGLAICKSIVEAHGGRIGVDSEPGKGSAFWFTIPNSLRPTVPTSVG